MIDCKLKSILNRKGMTRYGLAKKSNISYPTLHALYRNKSKGLPS